MPSESDTPVVTGAAHAAIISLLRRFLGTQVDDAPVFASPAEVVEASKSLGVTGHINRVLNAMEKPDNWHVELRELLHPVFLQHSAQMMKVHEDAKCVMKALKDANVPCLPHKGVFLSQDIYGDPALRRSGDIDIILPLGKASLRHARAALEGIGYKSPDVAPVLVEYYETEYGELPMVSPDRTSVDIHHTPFDDFPRTAFLEAGTRAVKAVGTDAGTRMSNIDALMMLSAHYWTVPRGERIRWLVDCGALLKEPQTFYGGWMDLVRKWHFQFYVTVTARAVRKVLDAPPSLPPAFRYLEEDLNAEQKGICERVTKDGPDCLAQGLVQKIHRLNLPKAEKKRIVRKYLWPHPGRIALENPSVKTTPGLVSRLKFAGRRLLRALRAK